MTIAMPSTFPGKASGPLRRHARQPCPDSMSISTISASFVRMRRTIPRSDETRHSVRARFWDRAGPGLRYRRIFSLRLWRARYPWPVVASNTGYTIASVWASRARLQANVASGAVRQVTQSFNPLFPKFAYFTEARSMHDQLHRCLPLGDRSAVEELAFRVGVDVLWRYQHTGCLLQPPGFRRVRLPNKKRFSAAVESPANGRRPPISPSTPPTSTS